MGGVRGGRQRGEVKGYPSWMPNSRTNALITSSQTHMSTPEQVFIYHFSISVQLNVAYLEWQRQARLPRGSAVSSGGIYAYVYTYTPTG